MTVEMTCREAEGLMAAFALDALERDETVAVALHLADCRNHDADLAELRAVASRLPAGLEPVVPPPALRDNLLASFDFERTVGEHVPVPMASRQVRARLQGLGWAYGLAAGLLLLVAGLAAWSILRGDAESSIVNAYEVREGDTRLTVVHLPRDGVTVVTGDMSVLPPGRVYQAWLISDDGTPRSLGLMPVSGPAVFDARLENVSAVAVTVEPEGGSQMPTTEPVVVARTRR